MTCELCNVEHKIAVPFIHLNGTSPEELLLGLNNALDATREAVVMLYQAAPNGRDHYPSNTGTIAQAEHTVRAKKLCDVREELEEMRNHVQAVIDFKNARKATARRSDPEQHLASAVERANSDPNLSEADRLALVQSFYLEPGEEQK